MDLRKGSTHRITIDKLVYRGMGLGSLEGFKVFVHAALPGDIVEARLSIRKKNYAEAKIVSHIERSPLRSGSPCPHYPDCGGCQMIDVPYEKQLEVKTAVLRDCFTSFFRPGLDLLAPMIACAEPEFYRNKMEFSFGGDGDAIYAGLKRRGRFDQVVYTPECRLQSPVSQRILKATHAFLKGSGLDAWNPYRHTGLLRHLVVRESKTHNKLLINLVISRDAEELVQPYLSMLQDSIPEIASVFLTVNESIGDTAVGAVPRHLHGDTHLHETLNGLDFRISPTAFFQTNTVQAGVLYKKVVELADADPGDTMMDLYCGTGTIGLAFAGSVARVTGVDDNADGIEDAKVNARINAIENAEFICADTKAYLRTQPDKPSFVVIDPPRSGMVPKALLRLIELDPAKIVYVSCNPVTLARDLATLMENGYTVETIHPVDMFPNTFHVENVCRLVKKAPT